LSGMNHLLNWATPALREAGIESPQLDAEVLLAHSLGISRSELHARLDQPSQEAAEKDFRSFIARRLLHEPVAYITGHKEFYGLDMQVDRRVLIPRPETETLVEVALAIARQHHVTELAEVGVGSGAVAIALAVNLPETEIYATDSSAQALEVAEENCRRHDVWDRVHLAPGDLLNPLPEPVGIVVANLPYVAEEELDSLASDITEYEPLSALDGGPEGLDHIRRLLEQAGPWLKPPGMICLEIGAAQALGVNDLARKHFPAATVALVRDLSGLDRVVIIAT
jgi:release factor glutamine methyltransferase